MKASYSWLRSLLPGLEAPPGEVGERLTRAGLEVEELHEYGPSSRQVVLAVVRAVEPHPKRSGLTLVTVDHGPTTRLVCGAPNVPAPGAWVVMAPLGVHLPAVGVTVAEREIAGVRSPGMLCSESELGLVAASGPSPGIIVLPAAQAPHGVPFKPGMPLREANPATHDHVFDIGVTPNRPDALGHVGLARELGAIFGLPFVWPEPGAPPRVASGQSIAELCSVGIEDTERCPHYGAAVVLDVTVGPSPDSLRYRLESLGVRAINNVVDVTNQLLLEFGQPTHAFDLELLPAGRIVVRRARDGERMRTLDGVERVLSSDDLVITDGARPVALAGVMGGENTEIRATTKRVLLECAYFTPRGIRRTGRRHGLSSESSFRFERGVDPEALPRVMARGRALLSELGHGAAVSDTILAGVPFAPRRRVALRPARLNALLGLEVPRAEAVAILARLGFEVAGAGGASAAAASDPHAPIEAVVPSHRPDIEREVDLIEEVMRLRGIDAIPTRARPLEPRVGRSTPDTKARLRTEAIALGLSETVTYGFVSPADLEALGAPKPAVVLLNPLREERSVMRTSLLPGLLEVVRRARRHGVSDVRVFSIGACFLAPGPVLPAAPAAAVGPAEARPLSKPPPLPATPLLPCEAPWLAVALCGTRTVGLSKPEPVDVYDAKGLAIELVERVTRQHAELRPQPPASRSSHLHPRAAADVWLAGSVVGRLGPLHPEVGDKLDLGGEVIVIELDIDAIARAGRRTPSYQPIPGLPAATRDIALVVPEAVTAGQIAQEIAEAAGELCESVELFDLYRGANLPAEHRSLAFHIIYRDPKAATDPDHARTLTDQEVDERHRSVVAELGRKLGAQLRGPAG